MKFEDALNKTYDQTEAKSPDVLKDGLLTADGLVIASVVWNMVAIAQKEKGLDDFVIIRNNNINSMPFKNVKETSDDEKENTKKESTSPKSKTATSKKVDVKEKEKANIESATDPE